ncbi:protein XRI1-like [Macadamia integrifolia]|uniref:protein XRI1-like n=1 Tax=Macadamia integrifolia TaxID=60698 RepID=UPI001C4F35AD|nr:protein XRI1-like [Macadamia integrifolia]
MDFNNNNEPWEWPGDEYHFQKDSHFEISNTLWDEVNQNEESLSYMFDETTPIKACGDLAYHVTDSGKNMIQEPEEHMESSSHLKRRRMLQFNTSTMDHCYYNDQISSAFVKSKDRDDQVGAALANTSDWASELTDDRFAVGNRSLGQSSEGWLVNCFNDTEMHFSSDDVNVSGASDEQIDISEFCNFPPEVEVNVVQGCSTSTPKCVFKGRKSFIQTPTKMSSAVAYPFALIKPCSVHGNVTLKDINQRIRTPPPSKSKQSDDDASASYPTSAFSGKPVVVKTKIRTEGGKGSITIMRTKG